MAGFRPRQADHIVHTTLETGHSTITLRSDVLDEVITKLEPLLRSALITDGPVGSGVKGYWFAAREEGRFLTARLGATELSDDAIATMTVRPPPVDGKPASVEVSIRGLIEAVARGGAGIHRKDIPKISMIIADLERCIAWTWLSIAGYAAVAGK